MRRAVEAVIAGWLLLLATPALSGVIFAEDFENGCLTEGMCNGGLTRIVASTEWAAAGGDKSLLVNGGPEFSFGFSAPTGHYMIDFDLSGDPAVTRPPESPAAKLFSICIDQFDPSAPRPRTICNFWSFDSSLSTKNDPAWIHAVGWTFFHDTFGYPVSNFGRVYFTGFGVFIDNLAVSRIVEPGTLALLVLGLTGLAATRRRERRHLLNLGQQSSALLGASDGKFRVDRR